jgi:beta-glucanase (GH16 family)
MMDSMANTFRGAKEALLASGAAFLMGLLSCGDNSTLRARDGSTVDGIIEPPALVSPGGGGYGGATDAMNGTKTGTGGSATLSAGGAGGTDAWETTVLDAIAYSGDVPLPGSAGAVDTAANGSDAALLGSGGAEAGIATDTSDSPLPDPIDVGQPKMLDATLRPSDAPPDGWQLVWSDEFSDDQIDITRWNHEVNCWGGGNNEQECYVADAKNSFVSDGYLHIVAIADSPKGMVGGPENDPTLIGKPYSSARVNTQGLGDWRYGRIEVRAELPSGQGLWPAIWMLPTDSVYGTWARSGEIDITEAINLAPDNNFIYGTLQYGGEWPNNVNTGTQYRLESNAWESFHVYAIEWEEGEIRWFVDDVQFATQRTWFSDGHPYPAPFDQRFYLVLNLSVGGNWPGPASAQTAFPSTMLVDFVRVYQCSEDPRRGKGCGSSDPAIPPLPGKTGRDAQ